MRVRWVAVLILLLPCLELSWLAYAKVNEVSMSDWQQVAAYVRREWNAQDNIHAVPTWMDPLLRWVLGDLLTIDKAAAADDAGIKRVWIVSFGQASNANVPSTVPEVDRRVGRLRVRRWPIRSANKQYDFVENINNASVSIMDGHRDRVCPRLTQGAPAGGGLLTGPMAPASRFRCDPRRGWLWVGATILEDLDFQPRRCIWQHAAGSEPIRITFPDVTLADALVFHGGLYHMHERDLNRAPVIMRVLLNGVPVARFVHSDGDGWARYSVSTQNVRDASSDISIEVTASQPEYRSFCWSGYVQGPSVANHHD